jgi:hypothetical protein
MTTPYTQDEDDTTAYARTGVISPTGPLTQPLKTFVDFETDEIFRRKVNEAGMDVSGALRDWVFKIAHGKTFTEMVTEAQKVKSEKLFGTGPIAVQIQAKP